MIFRKKKIIDYDRADWKPMLLVSICTGEKTAGFKNIHTGEFKGECLIATESDLAGFKKKYGISEDLEKMY